MSIVRTLLFLAFWEISGDCVINPGLTKATEHGIRVLGNGVIKFEDFTNELDKQNTDETNGVITFETPTSSLREHDYQNTDENNSGMSFEAPTSSLREHDYLNTDYTNGVITFEAPISSLREHDYQKPDESNGVITFESPTSSLREHAYQNTGEYNGVKDYVGNNGFLPEFDSSNNPTKGDFQGGQEIKFQDNNNVIPNDSKNQDEPIKKKRRHKRRKPKSYRYNRPGYSGLPVQNYQGSQGFNYPYGNQNAYPVSPIKTNRYPQPLVASEALTAVTSALTSITLYDDYKCVAKLLCEAAGGRSTGSVQSKSSGFLQSVVGLQPLLTLLAAHNGVSSSPLFVFGRSVFLGMASKSNPDICRQAYPQCPTDPEQLVHYLNNHNGGFFRFFSAPQLNFQNPPPGLQNVEQFYNQLSVPEQTYGIYNPMGNPILYQPPTPGFAQQNYGFYQNSGNNLYNNNNYYRT